MAALPRSAATSRVAWLWPAGLALLVACGGGPCEQNQNVTAALGLPITEARISAVQSETSVVRTKNSIAKRRLVVGFNDLTHNSSPPGKRDGWARYKEETDSWEYMGVLDIPPGVYSRNGDPWLVSHGSTVFYASQAARGLGEFAKSILVARSSNGGDDGFAPYLALHRDHGVDGPKMVLTADGSQAVLIWQGGGSGFNGNDIGTTEPVEWVLFDTANNNPNPAVQILDPKGIHPAGRAAGAVLSSSSRRRRFYAHGRRRSREF